MSADDDRAERLAHLLDSQFRVPGTGFRFGIDALLGLLPGVGDSASALLSGYVVLEGWRAGVPRATLARMVLNVAIDLTVGAIPVAGDIFDLVWKANERNVRLIRERTLDPTGAKRDRRVVLSLGFTFLLSLLLVGLLLVTLLRELVALIPM